MTTERRGYVTVLPANGLPYIERVIESCNEALCCGGDKCGLTAKEAKEYITRFYSSEAKFLRMKSVKEFLQEYGYEDDK